MFFLFYSISLPRTFAHAILLPGELSLTCPDDSSFAYFRPLYSVVSFKGLCGQLSPSSCVTQVSLSVFIIPWHYVFTCLFCYCLSH